MTDRPEYDDEDRPCLYCGCPKAHKCGGVPVCDACCNDTSDIEIAFPRARRFLQKIIAYRVHGQAQPEPSYGPVKKATLP